jgi:hypothetical protein
MLAHHVGDDLERVERLFNMSGLARREKWVKREDYRRRTIERAINGMRDFSQPMLTRVTKRNQNIRSIQEDPRVKHGGPPTGEPADKLGCSREGCCGPKGEEEEQGDVRLAVDLADARGQAPEWEVSFELARRLRSLSPTNPEQFEEAVRAFCERAGRPFEGFWYAFLDCWDKVRTAEGEDVFAWAAAEAERSPFPLTPCPGPMYETVASIAYHLSRHTAPGPFFLPLKRLAPLLKVKYPKTASEYPMTVSRIISLLEKNGVIKCVDNNYSYVKRKAKEYRFVGAVLPSVEIDSRA